MSLSQTDLPLRGRWAIRIFICFAFAYFVSYAFRSVNAVIAPELMADLQLNNSQLGLLSSAYFIGFAMMQIPLGYALDHFGVRRTESLLLLFACVGSLTFALADGLWSLIAGRLLIGMGVSACLMGSFTAYRRWYSSEQQGQLASGMLVFGTSGALATTVPVQWALTLMGWRGVFFVMAVMVAVALLAIRLGLPKFDDHPKVNNDPLETTGFTQIISHPFFIRMIPMGFIGYGGFMALQTLWMGPWMTQVVEFSPSQTANFLFVFNLIMVLGFAFNAWFVPKLVGQGYASLNYVKWLLAIGLVLQFFAIASSDQHVWWLWILVALSATGLILGQSSVGAVFPKQNAGLATTSYNLVIFIGAFAFQWGIGWGIDWAMSHGASRVDAFKQVFFVFVLLQTIAYLWFIYYPQPLKKYLDAQLSNKSV